MKGLFVYKYIMLEGDFLDGEVMMSFVVWRRMKEEGWKFVDLDCFGNLDGLSIVKDKGAWAFEVYYMWPGLNLKNLWVFKY
jgi:hypothetical protein